MNGCGSLEPRFKSSLSITVPLPHAVLIKKYVSVQEKVVHFDGTLNVDYRPQKQCYEQKSCSKHMLTKFMS